MRVGFLHLGQSVDFVVSISFLRSPVFAIFAMCRVFLLQGVSLHSSAAADGFNGAVMCCLSTQLNWLEGADSLSTVYMKAADTGSVGSPVSLKAHPSGAKARVHFDRYTYGLKPVPFKLTHYPDRKSTRLNSSHRCISYA